MFNTTKIRSPENNIDTSDELLIKYLRGRRTFIGSFGRCVSSDASQKLNSFFFITIINY